MFDWLLLPLDPMRAHDVGWHLSWHGRAMVMAWGVFVPVGIVTARYLKVMPGQDWPRQTDNRTWWIVHRTTQYSAVVLTVTAIWLILNAPEPTSTLTAAVWLHHWLGWTIAGLAALQVTSALLRGSKGGPTDPAGRLRGDHYDMTPRRRLFEAVHKSAGYAVLVVSFGALMTGIWQANAPRWMPLGLVLWWTVLTATAWHLAARGMAVPTYQAIWGLDPSHPGNRPTRPDDPAGQR